MSNKGVFFILLLVILGIGGLVYTLERGKGLPAPPSEMPTGVENPLAGGPQTEIFTREGREWTRYTYSPYRLEFSFPSGPDGYTLVEPDEPADAVLALNLFDSSEYEELVASSEPREAPPSVAVQVFPHGQLEDVETWVRNTPLSNFHLGPGELGSVTVDGQAGITYGWDGLYQGRSVAVPYGDFIYLFSVQFLTLEDEIRSDFDAILETVRFVGSDIAVPAPSGQTDGRGDAVEPRRQEVSWAQARQHIASCEVSLVAQTHALEVFLTLKDGRRVVAKEPAIDDVFEVVRAAESACGTIPIATE